MASFITLVLVFATPNAIHSTQVNSFTSLDRCERQAEAARKQSSFAVTVRAFCVEKDRSQ